MALDVHTTSSSYLGVDEGGRGRFENKRSEVGELLYRLKYRGDRTAGEELISTATAYLEPYRARFDLIVPVPASRRRALPPVTIIAKGIGTALGIPVIECVTSTRPTTQLKNVEDPEKRKELLAGLYRVDAAHTKGKNVLLFDDLFRSGSTMNAITDLLIKDGQAASVSAFTLTRTRSRG